MNSGLSSQSLGSSTAFVGAAPLHPSPSLPLSLSLFPMSSNLTQLISLLRLRRRSLSSKGGRNRRGSFSGGPLPSPVQAFSSGGHCPPGSFTLFPSLFRRLQSCCSYTPISLCRNVRTRRPYAPVMVASRSLQSVFVRVPPLSPKPPRPEFGSSSSSSPTGRVISVESDLPFHAPDPPAFFFCFYFSENTLALGSFVFASVSSGVANAAVNKPPSFFRDFFGRP